MACTDMKTAAHELAIDLAASGPDEWEQCYVTHDWDHKCNVVRMTRGACIHLMLHGNDEPTIEGTIDAVISQVRALE